MIILSQPLGEIEEIKRKILKIRWSQDLTDLWISDKDPLIF